MFRVDLNKPSEVSLQETSSPAIDKKEGWMLTLLMALLDWLDVGQSRLVNQTDSLQANANLQQKRLIEAQGLKYQTLPDTPTQAQIENNQIFNRDIDGQKALIQNRVMALKQTASVTMSQSKVTVDNLSVGGGMTSSIISQNKEQMQATNDINKR